MHVLTVGRKAKRSKTTSSHTTAIPIVEDLLRSLNKSATVKKISLGHITSGIRTGSKRLKMICLNPKTARLKVRGVKAIQELTVYTDDTGALADMLAMTCSLNQWDLQIS